MKSLPIGSGWCRSRRTRPSSRLSPRGTSPRTPTPWSSAWTSSTSGRRAPRTSPGSTARGGPARGRPRWPSRPARWSGCRRAPRGSAWRTLGPCTGTSCWPSCAPGSRSPWRPTAGRGRARTTPSTPQWQRPPTACFRKSPSSGKCGTPRPRGWSRCAPWASSTSRTSERGGGRLQGLLDQEIAPCAGNVYVKKSMKTGSNLSE
mmetsp:Transcript_5478/g.8784  ORF Transcript_5478/g.8784 Transcript_5478/m.8784 type:complete len:204 (+) Transcript_5478:309-920(+)